MPLAVCSCLCCWPLAILAIFNSRQVRLLYGRGQYLHAYLASRRTRALALLSIFTGSSLLIMYFLMSRRRGDAAGALGHDG
jgi:glucose-6-phosphate-specific signal transduction histidine kinase